MNYILQDFGKWKKLNEQSAPDRVKERGDIRNKVVANPIDKNTLKLKIVNDADVLDAGGKMTVNGFDAILNWIKDQPSISSYYPALNDLAKNIVVYTVSKDTDRKQVVFFKIYNKTELKAQDPSSPGINAAVRFVREDELKKALNGAILNTKDLQQIVPSPDNKQTAASGLRFPIQIKSIENSKDDKLISFLTTAYNKIRKEPAIASDKFMPMLKAELQANTLGKNSILFIKALNSGFAIADDKFPEDIETDITQTLYDKIVNTSESESTVIKGLDVDKFLEVIKAQQPDTGDIKVPDGGFIEGLQNDPELKKFQELLAKKFARNLANHATYQAFKKAGAKGYVGIYGPLTSALVKLLKMIAVNPKYPNSDGTIIEPEFVNMVQKVNESSFNYIGLDGITFICEDFDYDAADAIIPSTQVGKSTQPKKTTGKSTQLAKNPFENAKKLKAFQNWVIKTKGDPNILGTDGADGDWGPNSAKAWKKYRSEYTPDEKNKTNTDTKNKLTSDAISGYAHTLFLAMDGANTWEEEIYGVFRKIKTYADLAALNTAFKKEPEVNGQSLAYWLKGELLPDEFQKVFDIINKNGLMTKESLLELENNSLKNKDSKLEVYYEAYKRLAEMALKKSK